MGIRTAARNARPPAVWDLDYERCACGELAQRWFSDERKFYWVPCEGAFGGQRVSWACKMAHHHDEFAQGRDPVGKGGRPFRVSASEGWTQMGHAAENFEAARAEGKDLQLSSRS